MLAIPQKTYTNPDPRLHIGMLIDQYRIFRNLYLRMIDEGYYHAGRNLMIELDVLQKIIEYKRQQIAP